MQTADVPLQAVGLTKRFGHFVAVDDLSLTLSKGTVTGFLGPNGAGKSTTIRMIVGLISPTAGTARIFGHAASEIDARRHLGYLPADAAFIGRLSGVDNLDVLASLRGSSGAIDRRLIADALSLSGRDLERPVAELSSGMRQKLGLVAAMQHRPDLILLDEPANRLDPLVHRAFCELIRGFAADGRTILLSSHVLGEVEEVCDAIALIKSGRLVEVAEVETIRTGAQRRVTLRYDTPQPAPGILVEPVVTGQVVKGRIPAGRPDLVRELVADSHLRDVEIAPPSLEDVFLDLYNEEPSDADADDR
jgi:ABC-2 type transport system ATP-binding protein